MSSFFCASVFELPLEKRPPWYLSGFECRRCFVSLLVVGVYAVASWRYPGTRELWFAFVLSIMTRTVVAQEPDTHSSSQPLYFIYILRPSWLIEVQRARHRPQCSLRLIFLEGRSYLILSLTEVLLKYNYIFLIASLLLLSELPLVRKDMSTLFAGPY